MSGYQHCRGSTYYTIKNINVGGVFVYKVIQQVKTNMVKSVVLVRAVLTNKRGESSVGTVVSILISVVLGALLLGGLYALFGNTVMPQLEQKISDMFSYQG